jgi:hypothetical protein
LISVILNYVYIRMHGVNERDEKMEEGKEGKSGREHHHIYNTDSGTLPPRYPLLPPPTPRVLFSLFLLPQVCRMDSTYLRATFQRAGMPLSAPKFLASDGKYPRDVARMRGLGFQMYDFKE